MKIESSKKGMTALITLIKLIRLIVGERIGDADERGEGVERRVPDLSHRTSALPLSQETIPAGRSCAGCELIELIRAIKSGN